MVPPYYSSLQPSLVQGHHHTTYVPTMPITDVEYGLRGGYPPTSAQYTKSGQSNEKLPDEVVYTIDSEAESDVGPESKKSTITKVFDKITARFGSWGMETNGSIHPQVGIGLSQCAQRCFAGSRLYQKTSGRTRGSTRCSLCGSLLVPLF